MYSNSLLRSPSYTGGSVPNRMRYDSAEEGLKYLERLQRNNREPQLSQMVADRVSVQQEYGGLFHPNNLSRLKSVEFKEFLLYRHNRHWKGIHRHQAKLIADMGRLRSALNVLLDESAPIEQRIDWIEPETGTKPVPGLGKAVFTPILHVVYPEKYGVWNSIAESAMTRLKLWPTFARGSTFGHRYTAVNNVLLDTSEQLDVDLWTLDSLWWLTELQHEPMKHQFTGGDGSSAGSGSAGKQARAADTFVCSVCYLSKATNLKSENPTVCVDCSP